MKVLIVGADTIGAFIPKLEEKGIEEIVHWNARSRKVTACVIPARTDFVIFFTDFLQHTAARKIKKKIKQDGIPAVYCRRSWCEVEPKINQQVAICKNKGRNCHDCKYKLKLH